MESDERKKYTFMQARATIKNDKVAKRKVKNVERMENKRKKVEQEDAKFADSRQAVKKKQHRADGKTEKARARG